jgi:acetoin utilization deacetylase AcuC-like enzyme
VANRCCDGRIVSVLEGGYRIQGGPVSAFARSVAAHVRALSDGRASRQAWSSADAAWEAGALAERERRRRQKQLERVSGRGAVCSAVFVGWLAGAEWLGSV